MLNLGVMSSAFSTIGEERTESIRLVALVLLARITATPEPGEQSTDPLSSTGTGRLIGPAPVFEGENSATTAVASQ